MAIVDQSLWAPYRSGFEYALAQGLIRSGVRWAHEPFKIAYIVPEERKTYKIDFALLDNGILIESKGEFTSADRKKMKLVLAQHPELDIRILFQNPNTKIGKKSKTRYRDWCDLNGIRWAGAGTANAPRIPPEWLNEPRNEQSLAAIRRIMEGR
jgi:hypothetical protein